MIKYITSLINYLKPTHLVTEPKIKLGMNSELSINDATQSLFRRSAMLAHHLVMCFAKNGQVIVEDSVMVQ